MKLCDLHTHVLPAVDDGAPTMEYALQMLQNAVAGDVETVVVTPHCNGTATEGWTPPQQLWERFLQLQAAAADIPVQLVFGAECRVTEQLPKRLQEGALPTIGGSRYLLTEFAPDSAAEECTDGLQRILAEGLIPVVAHPERLTAVCAAPSVAAQWVELGCHLQLTGDSILGRFGRTCRNVCEFLLRNDLVACVASDAHGLDHRSGFLPEVYDHLLVNYSRQYANFLLSTAPARICRDEDL